MLLESAGPSYKEQVLLPGMLKLSLLSDGLTIQCSLRRASTHPLGNLVRYTDRLIFCAALQRHFSAATANGFTARPPALCC